ncbi:MAG: 4Fe-4S binding protein [Thermodesulfobacteriota bacterium]
MLLSPLYPWVLQYITLLVFSIIIYELLVGPDKAHDNFGTAMTWVLWWPLIPLLFLALGRFWCAVCPFATLSDLIQKLVGLNQAVPKFLKSYGIWIIDACFILITWADHIWGIVESPRGSGVLLLMIIVGVVAAGAFFERRTWCRYLCFLGGMSGNYARAGALELRATPEKCAQCRVQACYRGGDKAPGCPMFEFPKVMDTNARCNLCAYCIKNCPHDSIRLAPRVPSRELWFIQRPKFEESFLAVVIMGIVFVQNITMLQIGKDMISWLEMVTGTTSNFVTFTLIFILVMSVPILGLFLTGFITGLSNGKSAAANFTIFGYALIPLDLAGHLAHNLFHLLAEGKAILITTLALFGMESHGSAAMLDNATIQVLQYVLVTLGLLGSLYTAWHIAGHHQNPKGTRWGSVLPMGFLLAIYGVINFILFSLPMEMRM